MINGIIEAIASVKTINSTKNFKRMIFETALDLSDHHIGDSIAINGVCLTIIHLSKQCFEVDIVFETLNKTNLANLKIGDPVNLERMLILNGRISGHLMQGHVDTTATIERIWRDTEATWLSIEKPASLSPFIFPKGSIAIDGTSLTIVNVFDTNFSVMLIPHTQTHTISQTYQVGTKVNLEADMIAKTIHQQMRIHHDATQ
jgi:riboflavin synthase